MGGPHKILFFCKIDAGRVNLADKITMKLVHEALKDFECKNCGKAFKKQTDLTIHEKASSS